MVLLLCGLFAQLSFMNAYGPVIIIEDDDDDKDLLTQVFAELKYPNHVLFFVNGLLALDYLENTTEEVFLILSNIHLPVLSGFELRQKVHNNEALRLKCIPYLFFTSTVSHEAIVSAYSQSVQGFFVKPSSYTQWMVMVSRIMDYWTECKAPFTLQVPDGPKYSNNDRA